MSAFYTGNFGDVKVNANAGYTVRNENTKVGAIASKTDNQQQAWRLATQVEFGPASFGIEYGQTVYQSKVQHEFQGSARFVEVGAKYAVLPDVLNVYTQWQRNSLRSASGTEAKKFEQPFALSYVKVADLNLKEHEKAVQNVFIVGADYAFNKNLLAYAEFANSRVKAATKDKNVRESFYAAGLRVYF